jgi:hypothetical protein
VTTDPADPIAVARAAADVGGAAGRLVIAETKERELQRAQGEKAERLQDEVRKWNAVTEIGSQLADAATKVRSSVRERWA